MFTLSRIIRARRRNVRSYRRSGGLTKSSCGPRCLITSDTSLTCRRVMCIGSAGRKYPCAHDFSRMARGSIIDPRFLLSIVRSIHRSGFPNSLGRCRETTASRVSALRWTLSLISSRMGSVARWPAPNEIPL